MEVGYTTIYKYYTPVKIVICWHVSTSLFNVLIRHTSDTSGFRERWRCLVTEITQKEPRDYLNK